MFYHCCGCLLITLLNVPGICNYTAMTAVISVLNSFTVMLASTSTSMYMASYVAVNNRFIPFAFKYI